MKLPYLSSEKRYGEKFAYYANFFREIAMDVDMDPETIFDYCDHPSIQFLLNDRDSSAYDRTCYFEALSYGDPGVFLACPGGSLSGLMLRELGTPQQINDFYDYLQNNKVRTFFALTEPQKGSDAGSLECQIQPIKKQRGKYVLNGEKCLFGNAAVGKIGVILARTHQGPLGIRAVLISPEKLQSNQEWITRVNLEMSGLRGAQIGYMRFNNCPISSEDLLGGHLRPMEQGMMAIIKTFNRLRTGVGALAIGQAQAVLDYLYQTKKEWSHSEKNIYCNLYYKIESARQLLKCSAKNVDQNPFDSFNISIAKVQATHISEQVITTCISLLDPASLLKNQWLAKSYRDCFCWEYMEGTKNMQLKNIFQTFQAQTVRQKTIKFNDDVNS